MFQYFFNSSCTFYQCINDVIIWSEQYPDNWKRTWFETEKNWGENIGCPDGVFKDFNIDAKPGYEINVNRIIVYESKN